MIRQLLLAAILLLPTASLAQSRTFWSWGSLELLDENDREIQRSYPPDSSVSIQFQGWRCGPHERGRMIDLECRKASVDVSVSTSVNCRSDSHVRFASLIIELEESDLEIWVRCRDGR